MEQERRLAHGTGCPKGCGIWFCRLGGRVRGTWAAQNYLQIWASDVNLLLPVIHRTDLYTNFF
jgi:hypothetical protein